MSALIFPGEVDASPFGKFFPYEGMNEGTIMLWDAEYAEAAGDPIPANAALMTNLARAEGAAIASLAASDLDYVITDTGSFHAKERTALGGIHIASTQAGSQNALSYYRGAMSTNLRSWLFNNTDAGEDYVFLNILWAKITRSGVSSGNTTPQPLFTIASTTTPSTNYFMVGGSSNNPATYPAKTFSAYSTTPGTNALVARASNSWQGSKPGLASSINHSLFHGGAGSGYGTGNYNKAASLIIYRHQLDIVDLSNVAGATLSDKVDTLLATQQALFDAAFASGGRFDGDTYTAAATLMP